MATCQSETVNSLPQALASDGYFPVTYRHYCERLAAIQAIAGTAPDDAVAAAQNAADDILHNILTARATTIEDLVIKLKALQQDEKDSMHASGSSNALERYAMLATDLDCIIMSGKAVRS